MYIFNKDHNSGILQLLYCLYHVYMHGYCPTVRINIKIIIIEIDAIYWYNKSKVNLYDILRTAVAIIHLIINTYI